MSISPRFAVVLATGLFSTLTFAAPAPNMSCTVSAPCQYADASDLGYCLKESFSVREEMNAEGQMETMAVVGAQNDDPTSEVFRIAAMIPVSWQGTGGSRTMVSGSTDEGDTWLQVSANSRYENFKGTLTMEQDFGFEVECAVTE